MIMHVRRRADNGPDLETCTSGNAVFWLILNSLGLRNTCTSGFGWANLIIGVFDGGKKVQASKITQSPKSYASANSTSTSDAPYNTPKSSAYFVAQAAHPWVAGKNVQNPAVHNVQGPRQAVGTPISIHAHFE